MQRSVGKPSGYCLGYKEKCSIRKVIPERKDNEKYNKEQSEKVRENNPGDY